MREENRRMRLLRVVVDLTAAVLREGELTREEGEKLVFFTRGTVLNLFPGKERVYDLIYRPRFQRLLEALPEKPLSDRKEAPSGGPDSPV
jgi:hypothetical protein